MKNTQPSMRDLLNLMEGRIVDLRDPDDSMDVTKAPVIADDSDAIVSGLKTAFTKIGLPAAKVEKSDSTSNWGPPKTSVSFFGDFSFAGTNRDAYVTTYNSQIEFTLGVSLSQDSIRLLNDRAKTLLNTPLATIERSRDGKGIQMWLGFASDYKDSKVQEGLVKLFDLIESMVE